MSVVVFDIGGVLAPEGDRIQRLVSYLASLGVMVEAEKLNQAYWHHRDAYDLAESDQDYWSAVLNEAGITDQAGVNYQGLGELDGARNAAITPESQALVDWLVAHGVNVALLSNAPMSMVKAVRQAPWAQVFPVKVFSSEVGISKPSPAIYEMAEQMIAQSFGAGAGPVFFFDDRAINLANAADRGWKTHLFISAEQCRITLEKELF